MTDRTFGQVLAWLLVVVCPAALLAADAQGGILHITNSAVVNGVEVRGVTAIFQGDRVHVPNDSAVALTAQGSHVAVAPGSTITFSSNVVVLQQTSGVAVSTSKHLAVRMGVLRIAPAGAAGTYLVARAGGEVLVEAKKGAVRISDSTSTRVLAEGTSASVRDPAPEAAQPEAAATPQHRFVPGPTAAAILVTLAAVTIGLLTAKLASGGTPVSPDVP